MAMIGDDGDDTSDTSMQQFDDNDDDDDDVTIEDIEQEQDDDDFEGIDYSDKNLLIQLLMNQQLSAGIPITSRIFDKYTNKHYVASSVELQGYRDSMEDEHLIHFKLKNHKNCSVFGVFDGHGGELTSKFVKNSLIKILQQDNIKTFDDESLIKCIKQLDSKWIQFENKRKKLKQKQIRKQQQKFEQEAIKFTLDSDEEEDEDEDDDIQEDKEEEEEEEKKDDKLMKEMLSSSISDDKDKKSIKKDDEDRHPMNTVTTNEYGSVGSTCVFSIVEYNEKKENYKVCININTLFIANYIFKCCESIEYLVNYFMYNLYNQRGGETQTECLLMIYIYCCLFLFI